MDRLRLRAIYALDVARFALFRARHRERLQIEGASSPNLRMADLRIEPGGRFHVGPGFATERKRGNHIWVQEGGELQLGRAVWLRTEYGPNYITAFPGARISVGSGSLLNGAMLHSKCEITLGEDVLVGWGARIVDADLHPLDRETPERQAPVRIGDRVWIAADVSVLRGVEIGEDTVVGARSVVTRDLPSRVLALGHPAKPVREISRR
jgi:maltose O-acetyltransferase